MVNYQLVNFKLANCQLVKSHLFNYHFDNGPVGPHISLQVSKTQGSFLNQFQKSNYKNKKIKKSKNAEKGLKF
jgi:hypothetical protein